MPINELKNLNRRELVDIIYQQKRNEEQMQAQIAALQAELQDRHIKLSKAGSIAEAALSVTNVFAEAQASADLYLQEIAQLKEETEKQCAQRIAEAEKSVQEILEDGKEQCALLADRYKADYAQYQKLQAEIQSLKDLRKRLLYEGH